MGPGGIFRLREHIFCLFYCITCTTTAAAAAATADAGRQQTVVLLVVVAKWAVCGSNGGFKG